MLFILYSVKQYLSFAIGSKNDTKYIKKIQNIGMDLMLKSIKFFKSFCTFYWHKCTVSCFTWVSTSSSAKTKVWIVAINNRCFLIQQVTWKQCNVKLCNCWADKVVKNKAATLFKIPRYLNHLRVTLVSWTQIISASKESRIFLIPFLNVRIPFMFHVTIFMFICQKGRRTQAERKCVKRRPYFCLSHSFSK